MENILRETALSMGAEIVGFADISDYKLERYSDLGFAVTFAVRLSDAIMDNVVDKPTHEYFSHYRAVNALIDQISLRLSIILQGKGYKALPIAASQTINKEDGFTYKGLYSHRKAALLGGIGYIGKNNSLITRQFGPRVRLGTVLTNFEFDEKTNILNDECGACNLCAVSCPALALRGNKWSEEGKLDDTVDVIACSEYMSDKFKMIGRGSVCGICISVCPKGVDRI